MAKGVITTDVVPCSCYMCPCCITKEWQNSMCGEHYCGINEIKVEKHYELVLKPNWCPINPLPEEKKQERNDAVDLYVIGWNDCLKKILRR